MEARFVAISASPRLRVKRCGFLICVNLCKSADAFSLPNTYNPTFLNRSAFPITVTELKVIAALAIMGLRSNPKKG